MSYAWSIKRKTVDRETMIKVLTDIDPTFSVRKVERVEKEILPVLEPEAPEANVFVAPEMVGPIFQQPPARGAFSKFTVMCLVGFVLGWFGFQPDIRSHVGSTWTHMSTAVKHFVVPSRAAIRTDQVSVVEPAKSIIVPQAEGPSEAGILQPAQNDAEDSTRLNQGHN